MLLVYTLQNKKGDNTMNRNKKTKNKKVNESISFMGNGSGFEDLSNDNKKAKVKKNNSEDIH
jgi:hypothetical protein